ncbi:MAG: choice-of-anchor D domain-containing protein [Myxococcota bacterium]
MLLLLVGCIENTFQKPVTPATAPAPAIAVEPAAVDFGVVTPGASAFATVTVQNIGTDTLALSEVALALGSGTLALSTYEAELTPGTSTAIDLMWSPLTQPLDDVLEIGSNDPDRPVVGVPVVGHLPDPDLAVSPESVSFGDQPFGAVVTATVTVQNVGGAPLHVSDLGWTSADPELSLVDAGALGALPATLDPGAATELVVQFAPNRPGSFAGAIEIGSDDPDTPVAAVPVTGSSPDPCDGYSQTVGLTLTADDAWQAWIDGVSFTGPGAGAWNVLDTFTWELPCGNHTLAIYATDTALAISGVIAAVQVEGATTFTSGVDHWTIADAPPPAGWTDVGFDDSSWKAPEVCADTSLWGAAPDPLYAEGAQWIWWTSTCTNLGEAWFRLNFTVP